MSVRSVTIDPRTQRGTQIEEALQQQGMVGSATMTATYYRMEPELCPATAHVCDITGVIPPASTTGAAATTGVAASTTGTTGVVTTGTATTGVVTTGSVGTTGVVTTGTATTGVATTGVVVGTTGAETNSPVPSSTSAGEDNENNATVEKVSMLLLGVLVVAQVL